MTPFNQLNAYSMLVVRVGHYKAIACMHACTSDNGVRL